MKIGLLGASGRMGRELMTRVTAAGDLELAGALAAPDDAWIGQDAGLAANLPAAGVKVTASAAESVAGADVAVDFSSSAVTAEIASACADAGCALVEGVTGIGEAGQAALEQAAGRIAVLQASNMSLGVYVLNELLKVAAGQLGEDYDLEIVETHHRGKADAPSGTALQLGRTAAAARGREFSDVAVFQRHGQTGAREKGSIGFSAVRGGGYSGNHSVLLAGNEEVLELRHQSLSRGVFAAGALRAARWLAGRPPGLYDLSSVMAASATR
ncbi:MAG: 4-hydroxy-tetrahydrodipicolinate reductase [Gammaproteobacteria bacterium]|nr:4-hydroxy-tetrahydrodipicolinate reductase [Gammaproteobacteria bacterium]